MRLAPPTALLAVSLTIVGGAAAQETIPFRFAATDGTPCNGEGALVTTADLDWDSYDWGGGHGGCVNASLSPDGSVVSFTGLPEDAAQLRGANPEARGTRDLNVVPGDPGELYALSIHFVGTTPAVDTTGYTYYTFALVEAGASDPYVYVSAADAGGDDCGFTVRGGTRVLPANMDASIDAGTDLFNVAFELTYEALPGATVLTEVNVTEGDLAADGSYAHVLPEDRVELRPGPTKDAEGNPAVIVDLAQGAAEPRDITVAKDGGTLVAPQYVVLTPGFARDGDPHRLTLDLTDVELCLTRGELFLGPATNLTLAGGAVRYGSSSACIGIGADATLAVAPETRQSLGTGGVGMQLWRDGGTLRVGAGAEVSLGGILAIRGRDGDRGAGSAEGLLVIEDGGRVVVTEAARTLRSYDEASEGRGRVRVVLGEGATFDASAAVPSVRAFFGLDAASAVAASLPPGDYRVANNPARAGSPVTLLAGPSAAALARVDVFNAAGRLVHPGRDVSAPTELTLSQAGVYTLRLTDVEGRVGSLRAVVVR